MKKFIILLFTLISTTAFANTNKMFYTNGTNIDDIRLSFDYIYKHNLVQLSDFETGDKLADILHTSNMANFSLGFGFFNRVGININIPCELSMKLENMNHLGINDVDRIVGGLSNISVDYKIKLFKRNNFSTAIMLSMEVPTAVYDSVAEYNTAITPKFIAEYGSDKLDIGVNIGYNIRSNKDIIHNEKKLVLGNTIDGSVGIRVPIIKHIDFMADGKTSLAVSEGGDPNPSIKGIGGFRLYENEIRLDIGAGGGITRGIESPAFELIASLSWSPKPEKIIIHRIIERYNCCDTEKNKKAKETAEKENVIVKNNKIILPPVFFGHNKEYIEPTSDPVSQ